MDEIRSVDADITAQIMAEQERKLKEQQQRIQEQQKQVAETPPHSSNYVDTVA